jgi:hypothetical protein
MLGKETKMNSGLGKMLLLSVVASFMGCATSPNAPFQSNAELETRFEEGVKGLKIDHNLANLSESVYMFRYYLSIPTVVVPIVEQGAQMKPYLATQAKAKDQKTQMLAKALLRIIDCPERKIEGPQESGTISLNGKPYRAQFTVFALNYLNERITAPLKDQEHNKASEPSVAPAPQVQR